MTYTPPMRLTGYKLYPYHLPLCRALAVRGARAETREGALLMVEAASGALGWGDIAPLPGVSPESRAEAIAVVREQIDQLLGPELSAPDILERPPLGCGSAAFALDSAVLGCMATEAGMPLRTVFSDGAPTSIAVNALLDGDPDPAGAEAAVASGFRTLKIKVGRCDPGDEARMVNRVRRQIGDHAALRLDANRAWSLDEAQAFLDALEDTRIEYLEEPLKDPAGLPRLAVPVALDESLAQSGWDDLGAVAVVIKPALQDGLAGALQLAATARARGMKVVVSSLFESGIGMWTLAALAAGIGESGCAHGLDTLRWFAEDVVDPGPVIRNGRMTTELNSLPILNRRVIETR